MQPFSPKGNKRAEFRLYAVLTETIKFINESEDGLYAGLGCTEIAMDLNMAISDLENGKTPNTHHLGLLFAPTGPIQETAMSSGWHDDYIRLSSEVDEFTGEGGRA